MFVNSTVAPADTLLGTAQTPLALRIRGSERNGQVVRLHSAKVAMGSSRCATLRMCAAGVAPVHCLILRGSEPDDRPPLVGRYAAQWLPIYRLADLNVGDRLSIGPIELEVIDERRGRADRRHGDRRQSGELDRRQAELSRRNRNFNGANRNGSSKSWPGKSSGNSGWKSRVRTNRSLPFSCKGWNSSDGRWGKRLRRSRGSN